MVRQVQPLRISKSTPTVSPAKMAASRPLSELGNTERRRNSPSYNQATKKMIVSRESSPYVENSFTKDASPRDFWKHRDPMSPSRFEDTENTPEREPSPGLLSPKRRASIEKLRSAGKVKASNIRALESKDQYDPSSTPIVERPSANRPLGQGLSNNSFTRLDSIKKENNPIRSPGHKRTESETAINFSSNGNTPSKIPLPMSPQKDAMPSPTKSSLARSSQFGLPLEQVVSTPWTDGDERAPTPRALHRHNKSVTFHEDPPVVNEYEHPTPEPSVSAASDSRESSFDSDDFDPNYSFERGSSADIQREDSFDEDLENADKTPIVLPGEWSRMSPDEARTELVDHGDDVFEGSSPTRGPIPARSPSAMSDGESRPLPPLPGMLNNSGISAAAERATNSARHLPSPPKRASDSSDNNEEIMNMTRQSFVKEEHVMAGDHAFGGRPGSKDSMEHGVVEEHTISRSYAETMDIPVKVDEHEVEDDSVADVADFTNSPPKISRESILRKVRNSKYDFEDDADDTEHDGDNSPARPSYAELAQMHPDDPIPSRENSRETSDNYLNSYIDECQDFDDVQIKEESPEENDFDMAAIPEIDQSLAGPPRSPSRMETIERQSSVLRHDVRYPSEEAEDSSVRYSSSIEPPEAESTVLGEHVEAPAAADDGKESLHDAMQLLSVKDYSKPEPEKVHQTADKFTGLPTYHSTEDFDFGMRQYITPSPPQSNETTRQVDIVGTAPVLEPAADIKPAVKDLPRPAYDGAEFSPPGTPDSALYHSEMDTGDALTQHESVPDESPEIPERRATIRTNGKLKARPSATPLDLRTMAEQRRLVSAEHPVPPIPQAFKAAVEDSSEQDVEDTETTTYSSEGNESKADSAIDESKPETKRRESRKVAKLDLDIPSFGGNMAGDGLDLDDEFDRVIENQKRGYLCRQNTKLVIATNRNFSNESRATVSSTENAPPMSPTGDGRSASRGKRSSKSSPRKPSTEQYLLTEPWNGKARRQSQRQASAATQSSSAAPSLPGSALGVVNEDFAAGTGSLEDEIGEDVERGRLFVKVVGVKDLDLPMPRNDRLYFQMTLDNGLHCVTTSKLELGKTAPIGQEFELVVLNDLEFQLTLTTKLPPPPTVQASVPTSPTKMPKHQKSSSLSRFLSSPKKRAERERQEREAAEAEERRLRAEAQRKRATAKPTAWDLLHELVNESDGSFARAYVNLKGHEKQCFGRQLTVDVPCYNEWALENDSMVVNSVRSKRGNGGPIRRPPYVVGHLELQLLYVPKPAGAVDGEMPKSMSSAIREMSRAGEVKEVVHEGHLSQEGGDCVHWRRRFFRLQGARLTAYHEHTHQKRAVINLSKATRLVDDKSTLVADPKSGNPSSKHGRRKSAFAEEDEGYQYVEEGFRIRFANGETIDFYADRTADKDAWMVALSQVIGKPDTGKKAATWTDLVLARERAEGLSPQIASTTEVRDFTKPPAPARKLSDRKPVQAKSAPSGLNKEVPARSAGPPIADEAARPNTPPMNPRRGHRSRDAVKSMIF